MSGAIGLGSVADNWIWSSQCYGRIWNSWSFDWPCKKTQSPFLNIDRINRGWAYIYWHHIRQSMGFLHSLHIIPICCRWSVGICFTFDVQFRKKTDYEQHSDDWHFCWVVCRIHYRSNSHTWRSLIVDKRNGALNLLSAIPLLAITLSALIIMATTVAATTSLSWSLLLNNNNNIKLAKKISLATDQTFLINLVMVDLAVLPLATIITS